MQEKTRLYAFGSNGSGQLGIGHLEDTSTPQECVFETPRPHTDHPPDTNSIHEQSSLSSSDGGGLRDSVIHQLVAGGNHTLLQTNTGIFAAGNNVDGRCALDNHVASSSVFSLLNWTRTWNVTHVAATWEASFFVKKARTVYVCGSGSKGELGLGEEKTSSPMLSEVFSVARHTSAVDDGAVTIQSIHAGMNHVVVLLSTGELYGWGSCRKGQLGDDVKSAKIEYQPVRLQVACEVRHVTVGRDFTFLIGRDGKQLLLGDTKNFREPINILNVGRACPKSGWSCLYHLADNKLQAFGRDDRGQLPHESVPVLSEIAAGSEHVLALTEDGAVISWGWGEHGNCGTPIDDRGCVVGRYNCIQLNLSDGTSVVGVGAGCASSFFWTDEHT